MPTMAHGRGVTRTEIVGALQGAFTGRPMAASELVEAASQSGARQEVLQALKALPTRTFSDIRQIWTFLQGVPIS